VRKLTTDISACNVVHGRC